MSYTLAKLTSCPFSSPTGLFGVSGNQRNPTRAPDELPPPDGIAGSHKPIALNLGHGWPAGRHTRNAGMFVKKPKCGLGLRPTVAQNSIAMLSTAIKRPTRAASSSADCDARHACCIVTSDRRCRCPGCTLQQATSACRSTLALAAHRQPCALRPESQRPGITGPPKFGLPQPPSRPII